MKFYTLSLLTFLLLLSCGSASKLTTSLKLPFDQVKSYQNLNILTFAQSRSSRAIIENAMENSFRARKIKAKATFTAFPLAGDRELLRSMDLGPEEMKNMIREKVHENKIDAILTISLLDAEKTERYVQGSSLTVGGPLYASAYPEYNYGFYDYYSYAYRTTYSKGYYATSTTYFLELNLYDIESEQLIWTAQTKTKDPDSIQKEAANYAELVVKDILSKKVLKP